MSDGVHEQILIRSRRHLLQNQQLREFAQIILAGNLFVSLLLCFAGFAVWRFLLGLTGLGLGAWGGLLLGAQVAQSAGSPYPIWGAALIGAMLGCALLAGVVPLGTFLVAGWWGLSWSSPLPRSSELQQTCRSQPPLSVVR